MSLLKLNSTLSLEKRVEVLENQVKELFRQVGKPQTSAEKKDNEDDDDEYCTIS